MASFSKEMANRLQAEKRKRGFESIEQLLDWLFRTADDYAKLRQERQIDMEPEEKYKIAKEEYRKGLTPGELKSHLIKEANEIKKEFEKFENE